MAMDLCSGPRLLAGGLVFAAAGLMGFSSADAALLGDRFGTTVDYLNITEGSITDPLPLFGSPSVIPPGSDVLTFNPTAFGAAATSIVGGIDITDGTLSFVVTAHQGKTIDSLTISEAGGYSLIGPLTGSGAAQVSAALLVVIDYQTATSPFTPFTASYTIPAFTASLPTDAGVLQAWSLNLNLDLDALLPGVDLTQIKVTLNNQLVAQNAAGSAAFIDKKSFVISSEGGDIVPEPATLSLLGLASFGLLARRRMA